MIDVHSKVFEKLNTPNFKNKEDKVLFDQFFLISLKNRKEIE